MAKTEQQEYQKTFSHIIPDERGLDASPYWRNSNKSIFFNCIKKTNF